VVGLSDWPQLGVASRTRSFQMAFSCGDGYAHRWARHLMMMMRYKKGRTVITGFTRNLAIANRLHVSCAQSNNSTEMTFNGHSRSSEMSWFDTAQVIFLLTFLPMAVLYRSHIYSEILVENCKKIKPHLFSMPPNRGDPAGISQRCLVR